MDNTKTKTPSGDKNTATNRAKKLAAWRALPEAEKARLKLAKIAELEASISAAVSDGVQASAESMTTKRAGIMVNRACTEARAGLMLCAKKRMLYSAKGYPVSKFVELAHEVVDILKNAQNTLNGLVAK